MLVRGGRVKDLPACATRSCAARSTPVASPTASRPAAVTARRGTPEMPRKGPAPRRDLMPDPVYRSVVVTQVVNKILQRGKRSIAEKIVYDALADIEKRAGGDPVAVLKRAVENVRPALEVRSRRVGGATYQVPVEVRPRRATTLAIRWIVGYSRQRREKTMAERLANELSTRATGSPRRSSARTTCRRWPSRTRRSRTTGGDAFVRRGAQVLTGSGRSLSSDGSGDGRYPLGLAPFIGPSPCRRLLRRHRALRAGLDPRGPTPERSPSAACRLRRRGHWEHLIDRQRSFTVRLRQTPGQAPKK